MATTKLIVESKERIYLVGMMGAGKSTIGQSLASHLGYAFVDTDVLIEEREMPIAEIFEKKGEEEFRKLERAVLLEVANLTRAVIATGGGLPSHANNMAEMLDNGRVIYLKASTETLLSRLEADGKRPLLGDDEKKFSDRIHSLLMTRKSCYERADVIVDTDGRDAESIMRSIGTLLYSF
jgi:shikimate kinase